MAQKNKAKHHDFLKEGLNLPKVEEKVLEFWKNNQVFEKSLKNRKGKKTFVFYEGPPTANGRPGIHHVLARSFKDIILRHRTMQGFFVPRKGGWDTHGLPVELEVEKKLGLKSKKEIEQYGIAEFNQKCKESVWEYKEEWEKLTNRMGYWLDMDNPYVTYETPYVESLWWIINKFNSKGLIYKGHKIVPWCSRCGTALSTHELGQPGAYKEVTDNSVFVKFRLVNGKHPEISKGNAYILSWTTTPWTLPGNVALAVGEEIKYVAVRMKDSNEVYFLAQERISVLPEGTFEKIGSVKGKDMIGWEYAPLFDVPFLKNENSYKVYAADFVTTTDGTGVVHTAVMYGEDDYNLGVKVGLPQKHTVGEDGKFFEGVSDLSGLFAKSSDAENKIFEQLKANNNLLRVEPYAHEYPHCWRCNTPLLYYGRSSWFVAVNKVRKKLIQNNKKINWVPSHVKNGRFGEWLKEEKDWNFSRERYWGTPLPIWECNECGKTETIGSFEDLEKKLGKFKNSYTLLRHGQAETNILGIHYEGLDKYSLTTKGKRQASEIATRLKGKVDLIVSSDLPRTKETAKIVADVLDVEEVVFDENLREVSVGAFSGKDSDLYNSLPWSDKFERGAPGGESLRAVRSRAWQALKNIEEKYEGRKVLIVSHDHVLWMLIQSAEGWNEKEAIQKLKDRKNEPHFMKNGEAWKLKPRSLPRNSTGEVDPHRPYIDQVSWDCGKCSGKMNRVKEVADVWFDSGAMPLAQLHYPFENKELIDKKKFFPADYISEAMDQTRGWFYVLLAVGTLLGYESPYKNVISLGLINDKHGQKMSKSKGNVINPWDMAEKYGLDAVRWYLFTVTPPGEPKNFDESEVQKTFRKLHLIAYNSLVFFETYKSKNLKKISSKNILDKWIMARLNETIQAVTDNLNGYDVRSAGLKIEGFVDDLSRWYIRRSRRRMQPERGAGKGAQSLKTDHEAASYTLWLSLLELSKLMAPFSPFFAEAVYQKLGQKESVHMDDWSKANKKLVEKKLIKNMDEVRKLASLALAKRAELGIKVRQPLASLTIKSRALLKEKGLMEILRDEVNVKVVLANPKATEEIVLDTNITPLLKAEGDIREFVRMVQGLRQEAKYSPRDKITLFLEMPEDLQELIARSEKDLKNEFGAKSIEWKKTSKFDAELATKFDGRDIWLAIKKI